MAQAQPRIRGSTSWLMEMPCNPSGRSRSPQSGATKPLPGFEGTGFNPGAKLSSRFKVAIPETAQESSEGALSEGTTEALGTSWGDIHPQLAQQN